MPTIIDDIAGLAGLDNDTQPLRAARDELGRLTASLASDVLVDQETGEIRQAPGSSALATTFPEFQVVLSFVEYRNPSGSVTPWIRTARGLYRGDADYDNWVEMLDRRVNSPWQTRFVQIGRYLFMGEPEGCYVWLPEWGAVRHAAATYHYNAQVEGFPEDVWARGERHPRITATSGSVVDGTYRAYFFFQYLTRETYSSTAVDATISGGPAGLVLHTGYGYPGIAEADGERGGGGGFVPLPKGTKSVRAYLYSLGRTGGDKYGTLLVSDLTAVTEGQEITFSFSANPTSNVSDWVLWPYVPNNNEYAMPRYSWWVAEHAGRAFWIGGSEFGNNIYWSEVLTPHIFDAGNFMQFAGPEDRVVGVLSLPREAEAVESSLRNVLTVLCQNSIWALWGYDDPTFAKGKQLVSQSVGLVSPWHAAVVDNRIYFCAGSGFYRFNGWQVEPVHQGVQGIVRAAYDEVAT